VAVTDAGALPPFVVGGDDDTAQTGPKPAGDCGLISLAMIAAHYRIVCDPGQMAHDLGLGHRAATAEDVVRAARRVGLKSHLRSGQDPSRLGSVPLPAILGLKDGRFTILTNRLADGRMRLVDPLERSQVLENVRRGRCPLVRRNRTRHAPSRRAGCRPAEVRFPLVPAVPLALPPAP
jgi:subfamily B ATP-binding cassette protein HlyB/CyaB